MASGQWFSFCIFQDWMIWKKEWKMIKPPVFRMKSRRSKNKSTILSICSWLIYFSGLRNLFLYLWLYCIKDQCECEFQCRFDVTIHWYTCFTIGNLYFNFIARNIPSEKLEMSLEDLDFHTVSRLYVSILWHPLYHNYMWKIYDIHCISTICEQCTTSTVSQLCVKNVWHSLYFDDIWASYDIHRTFLFHIVKYFFEIHLQLIHRWKSVTLIVKLVRTKR